MRNQILFLSIVAALGVISASLCAPALPFIGDHFSAQFSYLQFTISLFLLGNACGQFFSGPLSDQIGQRTTLLIGLFLYVISCICCASANAMSLLLIGRFFQGMGSAAGPVLARAIATNHFAPNKSAQIQSYGAIGVGIASILAILSSGQITLISWRGNFFLAASLGMLLLFWTVRAFPSALETSKKKFQWNVLFSQMKKVWTTPRFIGASLCHALTYGLMYGYITLFPFLCIDFFHEKNPAKVGLYSAYMIAFYMMGAFFASRLVLKRTQTSLIGFGILLQLLSGVIMFTAALFKGTYSPYFKFLLENPHHLFLIGLSLFNFSLGIVLPLTASAALAPFAGHSAGAASSSLGLSYRLIGSILSASICQLPLSGGYYLGISIAFFSLAALLALKVCFNFHNDCWEPTTKVIT